MGPAAGAHYPLAVGAGDARVGSRHQPRRARSCELALRAVGAGRGRPGGAPLAWAWGVQDRALSHPRPHLLWGVRPGPTTHWLWVRGRRAWGPVTKPTARALASWLCALWGRHEGARGGASCLGARRPGSGALQPPTACPLRLAAGAHYPLAVGARGAGVRICHYSKNARSCELALRAVGAARWRPRGRLLPGCGASGVGRSPTPNRSSFAACSRGPLPTGCGCQGCGRQDLSLLQKRPLL